MKGASRSGARYCLVLGEQELADGNVAVRDMNNHEQETVSLSAVQAFLEERL